MWPSCVGSWRRTRASRATFSPSTESVTGCACSATFLQLAHAIFANESWRAPRLDHPNQEPSMRTRSLLPLSTALLLALPYLTAAQTRTPAPQGASVTQPVERRDDWQRPADIFAALGVTAGIRIADLGA